MQPQQQLILNEFDRFRAQLDALLKEAWAAYGDQMQCKKGCFSCCRNDFQISGIEQMVLIEALQTLSRDQREQVRHSLRLAQADPTWKTCPLLIEGSCSVYTDRPILCRIFGFPLSDGQQIATCELNFQDQQGETFSAKCFDMNALTAILTQLSESLAVENPVLPKTIPVLLREASWA